MYRRDKKGLTKTSQVLLYLLLAGNVVYRASLGRRMSLALFPEYRGYLANRRLEALLHKFVQQGWVKEEYKESKKLIKLTKRGQLEALFRKACIEEDFKPWDGKWRMVIFDIPEDARHIRDYLRDLLKAFGFRALQASVYVYPYPLNNDAIVYLRKSGLMRYIRFAKVEAFDDDTDIRKQFKRVIPKSHGREI